MKKECRTIFLTVGVLIIFLAFAFRLEKLTGEDRILLIADRTQDITWMLNPEDNGNRSMVFSGIRTFYSDNSSLRRKI
jgi:hypothetical protein